MSQWLENRPKCLINTFVYQFLEIQISLISVKLQKSEIFFTDFQTLCALIYSKCLSLATL